MSISSIQETLSKVESWAMLQQRNLANVKVMEDNLIKSKDHYMKFYSQVKLTLSKLDSR